MNHQKKWNVAKKSFTSLRTENKGTERYPISKNTIAKINDNYRSAYLSESREIERMTAAFFKDNK